MVKILVIEDEAPIRDEVMDWLEYEGYEVIGAENGKTGLQAMQDEPPDLIICDIAMPEMNGHELLVEVRSDPQLSRIPFVFVTASAEREAVRRGMDMGADDYLTKPFTHAEVLNAVRSRLDKRATQELQFQNRVNDLETAISEEREKHLLKTRLMAMFSHDFRNPLTAILSSSGILRSYLDELPRDQLDQHFDRIDRSVRLLIQMLDDMLTVGEMEAGHLEFTPQSVDLNAFVLGILDEFRLIDQKKHGLQFKSDLNAQIKADPKLLRQILTNLLSNAVKYSPTGSEITVTVARNETHIELIVEDQGVGIPKDSLSHVFEPFYRAANAKNVKGSGLGLSIVHDCVKCHKGTIRVDSRIGKGTQVFVEIPHTD